MSENIFWVSVWAMLGAVAVAITFITSVNSAKSLDEETIRFKTAIEAGLRQDIVQNRTIWVKP